MKKNIYGLTYGVGKVIKMDWFSILKDDWKPKRLKAPPKQIDKIIDYLRRNPQGMMKKRILNDLNLKMTGRSFMKLVANHPKIKSRYDEVGLTRATIYYLDE